MLMNIAEDLKEYAKLKVSPMTDKVKEIDSGKVPKAEESPKKGKKGNKKNDKSK